MAVLAVNELSRAGKNPVALDTAAAGGGDSFPNTGREYLYVANGDASSKTVTLVYAATTDGQAITNRTVAVPAGESMLIGPFPTSLYNDANGRVAVTYSAVTSVTVAVFSAPNAT